MSEKEFKSYRFNDWTDPTDEHLAELMRQAAEDTREKVNGLRMLSISIPIMLLRKSLEIGILLKLELMRLNIVKNLFCKNRLKYCYFQAVFYSKSH